ncbi:response regulator [Paraburkholderia sp. J67]|uniref:response regulator n=1 Tax=Paraburkholderia sp. J67 TaxID=2805435 RepID=UPI002ABD8F63|nr:response regulator [Paraburkholderia sp. J67]
MMQYALAVILTLTGLLGAAAHAARRVARATRVLADSERRYRNLIDHMQDGLVRFDQDGVITLANASAARLFGFAHERDMPGRHVESLWMPTAGWSELDDRLRAASALQHVSITGRHRDGTALVLEATICPFHAANEAWLGAEAVLRDVSESRRLAAAIAEAETRVQAAHEATVSVRAELEQALLEQKAVLEHTPVGICFVKDRTIVRCNSGFEKLFGYDKGEPVGKSTRILYGSDQEWEAAGADYKVIADNVYVGDAHFVRKDGTQIWCADHGAALDPQDLSKGSVWTALDVTGRKRAEEAVRMAKDEAEQASRMKSEFLANMSHEIRTPMNGVIGMSRLALKTDLNPKQRNYVEKIAASAESLLRIINDILDFSKIEAGKVVLEKVPFRLDDILDNLSSLVVLNTEATGVEVVFRVGDNIPPILLGDPLRLSQVLVNLGVNAAKFTRQGEIVVSVTLLEASGTNAILQFSIADTGIGMTESQLAMLFQSFSQADGSITRQYGGTGLGLAISKQLVEMMGGAIDVQSTSGVGSRFTFTTQFEISSEDSARDRSAILSLRDQRVLVVDDNAVACEVLAEMVASFGAKVTTASSGIAALDALVAASSAGRPIDLVLMDWRMPGWDGVVTTRCIRGDARISSTPAILMVTAYSRDDVVAESEGLHIDGFLSKPVSPSDLHDTLLNALYPALRNDRAADIHETQQPDGASRLARLAGARVLLVEDNAINREVALEFLAQAPIEVDVACNGSEALERILGAHYDLVLMDIQMPVMDGLSATRKIRAMAGFDSLPIIAMTAHAMAGDRDASRAAGMNDHITKPIDSAGLMHVLLSWIGPLTPKRTVTIPDTGHPAHSAEHRPRVQLPRLAGVDWQLALQRTNRNPALLYKLVQNFRADYAQSAQALLDAAQNGGDLKTIEHIAHGLKSSSAYLGAGNLSWLAREVEKAVRRGAGDEALALVPDLAGTLAAVVEGLGQLDIPAAPSGDMPDPARLASLMNRLAALLRADDARSEEALADLQAAMGTTFPGSEFASLRSAVADIEYGAALKQLEALAVSAGIQLGVSLDQE